MLLLRRLLRQDLEILHIFISLLGSLQRNYDKNIVFISPLRGLRCDTEKKFPFFYFVTTFFNLLLLYNGMNCETDNFTFIMFY